MRSASWGGRRTWAASPDDERAGISPARDRRERRRATVSLSGGDRALGARRPRLERSRHDVGIHADSPEDAPVAGLGFDEADSLRIRSRAGGMLVVVAHPDADAAVLAERVDIARDRAVAATADLLLLAVEHHFGVEKTHVGMIRLGHRGVADEVHGRRVLEIFVAEGVPNQRRHDLLAALVGDLLDPLGELDLEKARHVDAVVALQDVGDAAFAGLAVDADDGLVAAAEIGRIDRQGGGFPDFAVRALQRLEALVDR